MSDKAGNDCEGVHNLMLRSKSTGIDVQIEETVPITRISTTYKICKQYVSNCNAWRKLGIQISLSLSMQFIEVALHPIDDLCPQHAKSTLYPIVFSLEGQLFSRP